MDEALPMKKDLPMDKKITFKTVFSSRKTLAIQVKSDLSVVVRAPYGTSARTVSDAVGRHSDWIAKTIARVSAHNENIHEPSPEEENELIKKAKQILPQKVEYYANIMGVTPTRITITRAKTRFGSCSGKNSVSFSCRLMLYPDAAVDYVVVHELAHIRHHDHSAAFWAEVERFMPDYRVRKKLLKK